MKRSLSALLFLCYSITIALPLSADDTVTLKARQLVEDANASVQNFATDSNMYYLQQNLGKAEGVLIIPKLIKGAFIVGGSGGSGVLLAKDESNQWSYPAFYTMSSGSIGFQFGGQASEIVLMVMTPNGMDNLLSSSFKLGTDASVAAGPVGVGGQEKTADILAFYKSKGAFLGVSLEGVGIQVRADYNAAYYGSEIRPVDVLVNKKFSNPHADQLRASVADLVKLSDTNAQ